MPDPKLTSETTLQRVTDNVLNTDLDNETVMMDIEQGRYYGLNEVGSRIWTLLAEPISFADLCQGLSAEFEVPPERCERETIAFLNSLLARGLIRVENDEGS